MLIELFYIGMPVVRTDGRAYGHVITKFSRMGRLLYLLDQNGYSKIGVEEVSCFFL